MTEREPSQASESIQQSLANRETVAPSGLEDSTPTGSGPFSALPSQFGRYRVTKLLGRGAMGTVYLAHDPDLGKEVALKVPKFSGDEDPVLLERFRREARAAGDLNHANICGVYEVGQIGTTHFISMEYIDGRPLSDYISPDLPSRKIAILVRRLALALAQAHDRGIVHRDLKPANIMVNQQGEPVIMDFGLARRLDAAADVRATQSGMIVGSPAYMSPEQAGGENDKIGPWTDIYGLGVLFFELLTGSLPFRGSMLAVLGQLATQPPPKPSSLRADVDPKLESLCLKMLEKKPQNRPASMAEVAQSLTEWLKPAATKSTPTISLVEEPVALVPTKPAAPRADKVDGLEAHKQRVTDLLDKHQYGPALELLEKITNLRDAKFEKLVAWAKPKLKEVRAIEQKLKEASTPSCDTARQLLKHYDYVGVIQVLEQVPSAYRSVELRDLLEEVTNIRDECDHLQRDIEDAVRTRDTEILPALVKRLYKLRPNNKAIKQLAADLKQYGAARVIARRKGQRRFLDPAGRVVEPSQIILAVLAIAVIFGAVSVTVRNYLATGKRPARVKPSDQVTPTPPTPIPTPPKPTPLSQTITSQSTGMKLTLVPEGTFTMGSPASETGRSPDEGPQHTVKILQPFYMGIHEVTQSQYESVMGNNPSRFSKSGNNGGRVIGMDTSQFPVEFVSWFDAVNYCNKLSQKDGLPEYYSLTVERRVHDTLESATVTIKDGNGYRLPTEAEWEYACRAGTSTPFHFGSTCDGREANVDGTIPYGVKIAGPALKQTTKVGSYQQNAFGLFDMHGNVGEWCFDIFDATAYKDRTGTTPDPIKSVIPVSRVSRVRRGGSHLYDAAIARSAFRTRGTPDFVSEHLGFRVVRNALGANNGDVKRTPQIVLPRFRIKNRAVSSGEQWLAGGPASGATVRLVNDPATSGATWEVVRSTSGNHRLQCVLPGSDTLWLDGDTVNVKVLLSSDLSLTGTNWERVELTSGVNRFRNLGHVEGPRWLAINPVSRTIILQNDATPQANSLWEVIPVGDEKGAGAIRTVPIVLPQKATERWVIPTAESGGHVWDCILSQKPLPKTWFSPSYPGRFSKLKSAFGNRQINGVNYGTSWTTTHIYLRTTIDLPKLDQKQLVLRHIHDDDAWIYVNGKELDLRPANAHAHLWGYSHAYNDLKLTPQQNVLFREGSNTICVYCQQNSLGQVIDIGLKVLDQ